MSTSTRRENNLVLGGILGSPDHETLFELSSNLGMWNPSFFITQARSLCQALTEAHETTLKFRPFNFVLINQQVLSTLVVKFEEAVPAVVASFLDDFGYAFETVKITQPDAVNTMYALFQQL